MCRRKKKKSYISSEKEHTPIAHRVSQRARRESRNRKLINTEEAKQSKCHEISISLAQGQRLMASGALRLTPHRQPGRARAQSCPVHRAENTALAPSATLPAPLYPALAQAWAGPGDGLHATSLTTGRDLSD